MNQEHTEQTVLYKLTKQQCKEFVVITKKQMVIKNLFLFIKIVFTMTLWN